MQFLNRGIRVLFVNEKAEVDIRGAVRNHQDIDIGNSAERAASHAGGVFEVAANQADQRCLGANLNVAKLPQILDNRVQGRDVIQRQRNGDFRCCHHIDRCVVAVEHFEQRAQESMRHPHSR